MIKLLISVKNAQEALLAADAGADLIDLKDPEVAAFAMLEDWSNTGAPLSLAAAQGLAETLFADDAPGAGHWQGGGMCIDATALKLPILDVIARRDHIVPAAAALTARGPGVGGS